MSGLLLLTPPDGTTGDYFGMSVRLSADGRTAIIGGYGEDVGGNQDQGSARVFDWTGSAWVQRGNAITPTDGMSGDFFGESVSLSADGLTAIVGGSGDDLGTNQKQGSARVFVWSGSAWAQRGGPLTATDGMADDRFGVSVSLSADGLTAIVGGSSDDVGANQDQGSARVFDWTGGAWVQRGAALTPTDGMANDWFGGAVSLSANGLTAIVGGAGDDVGANQDQGSARVFDWTGSAWVQRGAALTPTDGMTNDFFGLSLSLSADGLTAIVGGHGDDVGANQDQGSARVFDWTGSAWVQRGAALTPIDGMAGDWFGESVSLGADGLTAIIGGVRDTVGLNTVQGSARVFDWTGSAWVQRGAALTPADGGAGDWFGGSVSLSADGRTALVGHPSDDVGTNEGQGSARVFAWNGQAWVEGGPAAGTNGILTPIGAEAGDFFGAPVSLSADGRAAIVGGSGGGLGANQGSATVFYWTGSAWLQLGAALIPTDGMTNDWFGESVSLSADGLTAIVGGSGDDVGANQDQGSARVFDWIGSGWVQRGAALTPTDGMANDWFGGAVSLNASGLTAIVGGGGDDVGINQDQGSARVFDWTGSAWVQRGAAITPTDGMINDFFGRSVSLSADGLTAIIGGPGDDVGTNQGQGSARVFDWTGSAWVQRGGAITPTDGMSNDLFGLSVSLSADGLTAIVGAIYDDVGANQDQGSARVFDWTGGAWVQRGTAITPTDGMANDLFGQSVSLSADGLTAIIGGAGDDVGTNQDQGSARVFDWTGSAWVQRGAAITPTDGMTNDWFGGSVSLSGDGRTALVGHPNDDLGGNENQGSARVFAWNGAAWVEGGPATGSFAPTEGADTISGTLNADTLAALAGDDVYIVNSTGDHVIEQVGGGMDTIITSVSMNLPANIEMLVIAPNITGITLNGGAGNDLLVGNTLGNTINGGGGDDVILVGNVTLADIYALFVT